MLLYRSLEERPLGQGHREGKKADEIEVFGYKFRRMMDGHLYT